MLLHEKVKTVIWRPTSISISMHWKRRISSMSYSLCSNWSWYAWCSFRAWSRCYAMLFLMQSAS